VILYFHAIY